MMVSSVQVALYSILWASGLVTAAFNATRDYPIDLLVYNSTDDDSYGNDDEHTFFKLNVGVEYQTNETTISVAEKIWLTTNGNPVCNTRYAMCAIPFRGGDPATDDINCERRDSRLSEGDVCLGPISFSNAANIVNFHIGPGNDSVEARCNALMDIERSDNCSVYSGLAAWKPTATSGERGNAVLFPPDTPCGDNASEMIIKAYYGPREAEIDALKFYDDLVTYTTPIMLVAFGGQNVSKDPIGLNGQYAFTDGACTGPLTIATGSRNPGDPFPVPDNGSESEQDPEEDLSPQKIRPLYLGTASLAASIFVIVFTMF